MNQLNYAVKRVLQIVPVLLMVTILIFLMIHMIPGDPARLILGEKATNSAVAALRAKLGLDQSLPAQYFLYLKGLLTLDLGTSLTYQRPVTELLLVSLPITVSLTLISTVFSILVSFPLGFFAGMRKDQAGDQAVRVTALAAIAMPSFWVALLLMLLFGVKLQWFPVGGWGETPTEHLKSLVLPAFTQSLMTSALLIRNIRNSVVDISVMDYVDFARSKGLSNGAVKYRHILRNALISTVTLLAMRMAYMLGGSVIIETVFSLPGLGKLMVDSIFGRDYAVVQSLVFLFAFMVLVINLLTDLLYSCLDPRVKF
ncbi:MAG TPA: ABC transporter permease [Holophaga sp.]|nr:ABC transporter permease [Holophaga sp.]HPS66221.1 ABC transporter permease [Holophaga sp.]